MIPFAKPFKDPACAVEIGNMLANTPFLSNGEYCRKFEEEVARISSLNDPVDYAIACSSCSQAMIIGLGASGARGACYTQSFTWKSTAIAGQAQGSQVWFREIDRGTWTSPDYKVSVRDDQKGYAIAVDTFGRQSQPESYLPLFFDRAHSLGVRFRTLGVATFLSFSPSKIVTCGEGGMVLTNKKNFAEAITNGRDVICRMPEASAIIGLRGLRHLTELLDDKKSCFEYYKKQFPECQFQEGEGNHAVIGMLFDSREIRDKVLNALKDEIEFKTYYEPLHLLNKNSAPMKATEDVYSRILCLPSWYKCPKEVIANKIRGVLE
jgi:dTDP-4-amino-4,6-dideoxygalactose transaminase